MSSLSDERIIRLVSRYFVPAWLSRDAYQLAPPARAEQDEVLRLDRDRARQKLPGGTVCVFILDPSGGVVATLPVQKASKPELLLPFLQEQVDRLELTPRDPDKVRSSRAGPPPTPKPSSPDARLFTVRTRFDDRAGAGRGLSIDRVELSAVEWKAFLPADGAAGMKVGRPWAVPAGVGSKLLRYAYPPLPHWKVRESTLRRADLEAVVVERRGDSATVRLSGKLDLVYPDEGKPTDGTVKASLVGYARADLARKELTSFVLVSDGADYVWRWEGKPVVRKMVLAVELEPPGS